MSKGSRTLIAAAVLSAACIGLTAISAAAATQAAPAAAPRVASITYKGAFEFEGLASNKEGKHCSGEGAFGVAKPGAKITISERDSTGDFNVIGTGKLAKGKFATSVGGDKVCRMTYRVKATAPADDSTVYFEMKGLTFNNQFPASRVADGDLGTDICEFSDNTCATVVGGD
jgi:hypothetical protein